MQKTPPAIKEFEGDIKSRGGLVFAFWLEVRMETRDQSGLRGVDGSAAAHTPSPCRVRG